MEDNVVDFNQAAKEVVKEPDFIKLKNSDVMVMINQTPVNAAFDKMQNALAQFGKPYYWTYKVWKEIGRLAKQADEERVELAKKYCDKDEKGEPKMMPLPEGSDASQQGQSLAFTGDNVQVFQQAFNALLDAENNLSISRIQIDSELLEKLNNKLDSNPITLNEMIMLEKIFDFVE